MRSRLKNFFRRSSTNNLTTTTVQYEATVASDPPLKGSYPVSGNGPNLIEEIQRSKAKREAKNASRSRQSFINTFTTSTPSIRYDDPIERPRTAPNNGRSGGHHTSGRTRSGFSTKSPPSIFSSRRVSITSQTEIEPPLPTLPTLTKNIQTYQPSNGPLSNPDYFPPPTGPIPDSISPFLQYQKRSNSRASHKSYIDLLDAHSDIKQGKEVSQHRAIASGVRNYGEDVADRNIADFGDPDIHKMDLNSSEFGYLKSIYAQQKQHESGEEVARNGSALSHVFETANDGRSDDTARGPRIQTQTTRSTNNSRSGPKFPSRINSMSQSAYRARDDYDQRGRIPLSSPPESIYEDVPAKDPLRPSRPGSVPSRGRALNSNIPPVPHSQFGAPVQTGEIVPFSVPPSLVSHSRNSSASHSKRQRAMSTTSQHNLGSRSRNSSVSYSAFPNTNPKRESATKDESDSIPRSVANSGNKRASLVVEGAREPPNLKGIVDLTNTVDTDVTTKTLPAVVHEKVQPTRHEIRKEVITREIHTHDVFHRVLPIIETEVLPAKHYIHGPDGKSLIEIPESQIPGRSVSGAPNGNWKIVRTEPGMGDNGARIHRRQSPENYSYYTYSTEGENAEAPVIGLVRGDPQAGCSRGSSRSSVYTTKSGAGSRNRNTLEPILSSKRESMSKDGVPKTEYVWHHPPTFENAKGENLGPVYIGAGLGDLSPGTRYHSDEDEEGASFGAMRTPSQDGGSMFRDSGYGALPGLGNPTTRRREGGVGNVDIVANDSFGEATKGLRRLREKRRVKREGGVENDAAPVRDVESGMRELNL